MIANTTMEEETYKQYEIKEGIVFLIELSHAVFEPVVELGLNSQLLEILRCINDLISDMVMTFPRNGVGIYLYNCDQTASKYPKDSGITKVFSLNDLNSSNMKILSEVVRDQLDGFKPLTDRYRVGKLQDNLHTVLKTVLREFQFKPQYNVKKLFWFTNNDKPYKNPALKDSLRTMISDFEDNRITISPVFLDTFTGDNGRSTHDFDISLYQNIFLNTNYLKKALGGENESKGQVTLSSQIRKAIFRLKEVRRIQFACDLILSDGKGIGAGLGCSVKGYTLYNHERVKPFRQVYTEGESLKLVHNDTLLVRADNQKSLEGNEAEEKTEEVLKGYPMKQSNEGTDEKVLLIPGDALAYMKSYAFDHDPEDNKLKDESAIKKEELLQSQEIHEDEDRDGTPDTALSFSSAPYLKLLCFRPLGQFQPYLNLKPPVFVTADLNDGLSSSGKEGGFSKSLTTFGSLYRSCIKLQRFGVLFGCTTKNGSPNLYALYPTKTQNSTLGLDRELPEGFLLIQMPWLGEIRSLPDYMLTDTSKYFPSKSSVPKELLGLYKKLVARFDTKLPYNPSENENPVLNYFYKTIKHEALQIDVKEEDATLEKNDGNIAKLALVHQKLTTDPDAAELVKFVNNYLNKVGNQEMTKRTAEVNEDPKKKLKTESLTEEAIIVLWKHDTWNKVTVPQLREFIARYPSIRKASKKGDMVANIVEFLESRGA